MHVYTFFFKFYSIMVYHRVLSIVRLNFTVAKCFLLCSGQDKSTRNLRKRSWSTQDFPGGAVVKNLPAMEKMQVQPWGQEDPLE